jgi:hypothetical protein
MNTVGDLLKYNFLHLKNKSGVYFDDKDNEVLIKIINNTEDIKIDVIKIEERNGFKIVKDYFFTQMIDILYDMCYNKKTRDSYLPTIWESLILIKSKVRTRSKLMVGLILMAYWSYMDDKDLVKSYIGDYITDNILTHSSNVEGHVYNIT